MICWRILWRVEIYSIFILSPHKRSPFVSIKLLSTTAKYILYIQLIQLRLTSTIVKCAVWSIECQKNWFFTCECKKIIILQSWPKVLGTSQLFPVFLLLTWNRLDFMQNYVINSPSSLPHSMLKLEWRTRNVFNQFSTLNGVGVGRGFCG